jgi:hypothetical protein
MVDAIRRVLSGRRAAASRAILLCAAVALAGAFSAGWMTSNLIVHSARETLPLSIAVGNLDFGEVLPTSDFHVDLPIANATAEPVAIESFSAGCNCVAITPATMRIAPHGTEILHLTLDLLPRDETEAIRDRRRVSVSGSPPRLGGGYPAPGNSVAGHCATRHSRRSAAPHFFPAQCRRCIGRDYLA